MVKSWPAFPGAPISMAMTKRSPALQTPLLKSSPSGQCDSGLGLPGTEVFGPEDLNGVAAPLVHTKHIDGIAVDEGAAEMLVPGKRRPCSPEATSTKRK